MGEIIHINEFLEKKTKPTHADIHNRLADIAIQIALLQSEQYRLEKQLEESDV